MGQLYFRIKRTDAAGNVIYSIVQIVNLDGSGQNPGIQVYPNPVVDKVNILFDESQSGNFILQLINTTGQVVQQSQTVLSGGRSVNLPLTVRPARGVYFLRAREINSSKLYLTKVLVN
jgi:hypothetical protein